MIFFTLGALVLVLCLFPVVRRMKSRIFALESDIAKLERNAELSRDIQHRQQMILDNIPDMFWLKDTESRYLIVNKASCAASGRSPAEIIGKSPRDIWPQDLAEQYCRNDALVMTSGIQQRAEEYLEISNGERKWIETIKTPVFDDSGRVIGTTGIARDINTRKQVEEALKESEERLRVIFEASQSGILQVDTEWRILFANRRMAEMLACPLEKLIGSFYVDHLHESERAVGNALMQRLVSGEIDHIYTERRYLRKDGSDFWGYFSGRILEGSDGTLKGLVGNITDITERKRIREIMVQTEKMATVGGLAAGMAHELNTPLGAILQHVQNIQRRLSADLPANETAAREIGVDIGRVQQYLERRGIDEMLGYITEAGSRAAGIITNMLAFSHTGGSALESTPIPELIDGAIELAACDHDLKERCDFRAIAIIREDDQDLPPIVINRREMERVLLSIMKNAAQALAERAPGTSPQIILTTRRAGRYACIDISDNGPGMTEEIARRVFDPFFTTREIGVGAGLGLSIAYALVVENHRGLIDVDSAPGRGATFTIRLPLAA